jgi:long-chain fatty acid transport protein
LSVLASLSARQAQAQAFGVELHNTLMPASGAMAGTSIADPQDALSAINANPATLTQFRGTQFVFGGGWVEPTYNVHQQGGAVPTIGAFQAKSNLQGSVLGNIGVTQDLEELAGLPGTLGLALVSTGGGGVDFRHIPETNGTSSELLALSTTAALGIDLTDRLAAGAALTLGSAFYDGPFVGISAMVPDYALRGTVGLRYAIFDATYAGVYYQTRQNHTFDNAILLDLGGRFDIARDIKLDLPENLGFGFADSSLCNGNLLLAFDVLYKQWDNCDLFRSVYDNQWVFQCGGQYTLGALKLRLGYAYGENPLDENVGTSAGGVTPPGAQAAIHYLQAQMAAINRHRVSGGIEIENIFPGMDMDIFGGGMFQESDDLGAFTSVAVESYWIGSGLTWRFGANGQ